MKNDFIKFDLMFDHKRLIEDLETCKQYEWVLHFNKNDYTGTWKTISLRSVSGHETDNFPTPNEAFQDTPLLANCPYFNEVIQFFQCPKEAVRLLALSPQSYIKEHTDHRAGYENRNFRIHVPLQSNEKVEFVVNNQQLPMKIGECWYANFNLPHSVRNDGENERIHLVIDCLSNEWSDKFFADAGYDFNEKTVLVGPTFSDNYTYDRSVKLQMIEQLSQMDTDAARNIISQLKTELAIEDHE
ncbi:MAG: aspartyl/asparaginyl beta-hydroxylase domain-containing protein [Emticicia sp.]